MANESGVLVIAETDEATPEAITFELLAAGRRLANELGQKVTAALIGSGVEGVAQDLIAHGADKVVVVDDPVLKDYRTDAWVPVIANIAQQENPAIILAGQTSIGRDLAPRLAFRLGTAAAMDTVSQSIEDGKLRIVRPSYGGNARAEHTWKTMPQIATVKPKSSDPLEADSSRSGEVTKLAAGVSESDVRTKVISKEPALVEGIRLEDAEIVVSGGRGLGGPEGFRDYVEPLADALRAAVGASRAACDLGWYPPAQQVGLTGKTVSPNLYVAVAISGASQHMAGAGGSKNIVAINKDPEANIVRVSRFAIIDDYKKVVPALIEAIKNLN
jgi:electron transfer flavoprotein alpha subunit